MSADWGEIFGLNVSPLELVVRGSVRGVHPGRHHHRLEHAGRLADLCRAWLQKVLEPPPLLTKLRENGITDPRQVDKAYMEPDGQVTVLKKEEL